MVVLFLLLLIIIFYVLHLKSIPKPSLNNIDKFVNYKKIVVTPQSSIYKKININTWYKDSLYFNIATNISNIYPIDTVNITDGVSQNIDEVENNINHLGFVQEDILNDYIQNKPNTNIRYITCIGLEQIIVLLPANSKINSWQDITNKKIGTLNVRSGSYLTLKNILKLLPSNRNEIINLDFNSENIVNAFNSNKIDMFFTVVSNPNNIIKEVCNRMPIKLLGVKGLDDDYIKFVLPNYEKNNIDPSEYKAVINYSIKSVQTKVYLICHKDFADSESYLLIKTLFNNFNYIRSNGDNLYKLQMFEFNPSYLYATNNIVQLHNGVRKFFKDINIITETDNEDCVYSVGINQCSNEKINKNQILI